MKRNSVCSDVHSRSCVAAVRTRSIADSTSDMSSSNTRRNLIARMRRSLMRGVKAIVRMNRSTGRSAESGPSYPRRTSSSSAVGHSASSRSIMSADRCRKLQATAACSTASAPPLPPGADLPSCVMMMAPLYARLGSSSCTDLGALAPPLPASSPSPPPSPSPSSSPSSFLRRFFFFFFSAKSDSTFSRSRRGRPASLSSSHEKSSHRLPFTLAPGTLVQ
mmetsp:Transcript_382/g.1173  ORF Transcript_382/g.1173 Transcript_382/m.1173 type:complete len:220 (-) Transcript_382:133-792(-)